MCCHKLCPLRDFLRAGETAPGRQRVSEGQDGSSQRSAEVEGGGLPISG